MGAQPMILREIEVDERLAQASEAVRLSIADVLIGDWPGSPRARGTLGLSRLFTRCGYECDYNGRQKRAWVAEALAGASPELCEKILIRACSPGEYHGDRDSAAAVTSKMNRVLITCGLQLAENGGGLRLEVCDAVADLPEREDFVTDPVSGLAVPDFEQLDVTADEARELAGTWEEAARCYRAGAFLAATIMLGSLLEALLLLALKSNRKLIQARGIRFMDNRGQERAPEKWSLGEMIEAASSLGWTSPKVKAFSHSIREYRNLVHPELRRRPSDLPRSDECIIASIIISGTVSELRRHINQTWKGEMDGAR